MLKRAQRLAKLHNKAQPQGGDQQSQSQPSSLSKTSSSSFSFKSPLTRLLAEEIGKGQPAKLLQKVSAAAATESKGGVSPRHFSATCAFQV